MMLKCFPLRDGCENNTGKQKLRPELPMFGVNIRATLADYIHKLPLAQSNGLQLTHKAKQHIRNIFFFLVRICNIILLTEY